MVVATVRFTGVKAAVNTASVAEIVPAWLSEDASRGRRSWFEKLASAL